MSLICGAKPRSRGSETRNHSARPDYAVRTENESDMSHAGVSH